MPNWADRVWQALVDVAAGMPVESAAELSGLAIADVERMSANASAITVGYYCGLLTGGGSFV